jgi:O-acetyl-ADP-ribose deacetylase (regulator of RNase III)
MLLTFRTPHPQQTRQAFSHKHTAAQLFWTGVGQTPDRCGTLSCAVFVCLPARVCVLSCSAGRLQAKFVIHTVGPVYENKEVSAPLLRKAYV